MKLKTSDMFRVQESRMGGGRIVLQSQNRPEIQALSPTDSLSSTFPCQMSSEAFPTPI